jgi:hypothetical protein
VINVILNAQMMIELNLFKGEGGKIEGEVDSFNHRYEFFLLLEVSLIKGGDRDEGVCEDSF